MNQTGQLFEKNFLNHDMEAQVRTCDDYELAGIIKDVLGSSQPILEAGCGSGRWCVWLDRRGYRFRWRGLVCVFVRKGAEDSAATTVCRLRHDRHPVRRLLLRQHSCPGLR